MRLAAYLDRVRLLAELAVAPDFHALTVADVEHLVFRQRPVPGFPVDGDMLARARVEAPPRALEAYDAARLSTGLPM